MRFIVKPLLVAGIVGAALATVAGPALADPPGTPPLVPNVTDIVGGGSDTTQLVVDKLSTDYNATVGSSDPHLYSIDAVAPAGNPATIPPKQGCAAIRPNGSGAGITTLTQGLHPVINGVTDTAHFCLDFARSSRGPQAGDDPTLHFLPFAEDAVTWAANATTNAPASLSTAQLTAIYSCDASLIGAGTGPVTWGEIKGTDDTTPVVPVIPQSASGTRAFFLQSIGVTTPGACVVGQASNNVEENEGINPVFSGADATNVIFPYSVAVYLAQTQHGHGAGDQGNMVLHAVDGQAPTDSTNSQISTSFPYLRLVYNVVRDSGDASNPIPGYLQPIFGDGFGDVQGSVCADTAAIADFGFLPIGGNCGLF